MFKYSLKYTSIFILLILTFYLIVSLLPSSTIIPKVEASSLDKDDVYHGMGIALLLILIAKIGQAKDSTIIDDSRDIIINIPDFSKEEIDILASTIHGEARGESYRGQVAVGAVILNRLKSPDFPNNIREIVYQKRQFSCVADGQINLKPNSTAYRAAHDAINGIDPSYGALYFYNPKTAKTLWWLSKRKTTVKIGNHVFAK